MPVRPTLLLLASLACACRPSPTAPPAASTRATCPEQSPPTPPPPSPSPTERRATHGLVAFPDLPTTAALSPTQLQTAPISPDDIDPSFAVAPDLSFLAPLVRTHRVLMLGENHYSTVTNHLVDRILFAANTFDRYPLVTLELAFSHGLLFDHYVTLDDTAAASFREGPLRRLLTVGGGQELLEHVRRWNLRFPERRIHVRAHDLEHDLDTTIAEIIVPYFAAAFPDCSLASKPEHELVLAAQRCLARGRPSRAVPPYITVADMRQVLRNALATITAQRHPDLFMFVRQRAIVESLTGRDGLGRWTRRGKFVFWGGAYHTSRSDLPADMTFMREATYFDRDVASTRGKVLSIALLTGGYVPGDAIDADRSACANTGLRQLLDSFAELAADGTVTRDGAYFHDDITPFEGALFVHGPHGPAPYRITHLDWPTEKNALGDIGRMMQQHDHVIVIPRSPVAALRCE